MNASSSVATDSGSSPAPTPNISANWPPPPPLGVPGVPGLLPGVLGRLPGRLFPRLEGREPGRDPLAERAATPSAPSTDSRRLPRRLGTRLLVGGVSRTDANAALPAPPPPPASLLGKAKAPPAPGVAPPPMPGRAPLPFGSDLAIRRSRSSSKGLISSGGSHWDLAVCWCHQNTGPSASISLRGVLCCTCTTMKER